MIQSFRLCCSSTATPLFMCGRTMRHHPRYPSGRGRKVGRSLLPMLHANRPWFLQCKPRSPTPPSQDGAAFQQARQRKQLTYPVVVLAVETGDRLSHEAHSFVCQLAEAKALSVPRILKGRTIQAWHDRWCSLLACASARAFALSLLERRQALGSDVDRRRCCLPPPAARPCAVSLAWCRVVIE